MAYEKTQCNLRADGQRTSGPPSTLTGAMCEPSLSAMEVNFTPEHEQQLPRIPHAGMDTEHFVKDAALRLVEEDEIAI